MKRQANNLGVIPSLGWKQPMVRNGYLDFDKNPIIEVPTDNILYNNNNRLLKKEYPNHFSYDWTGSQRNLRMKALFEARKIHSLESFKEIHSDIISARARTVIPLLANNLWYTQSLDMTNNLLSLRKRALELLGEWNREMSVDLPQPFIYTSWVSQVQRMVLQDEVGTQRHWDQ